MTYAIVLHFPFLRGYQTPEQTLLVVEFTRGQWVTMLANWAAHFPSSEDFPYVFEPLSTRVCLIMFFLATQIHGEKHSRVEKLNMSDTCYSLALSTWKPIPILLPYTGAFFRIEPWQLNCSCDR